ncbi:MAG: hypothetical protein Unbinned7358contig1000_60 [Prokaryotic dsDNA virus sp.]|nr:MAG: hypothetical protein Unbinned7358contig1000_60 [Prokaryotic dsDNA virus sp.]|tara:strand:+ start:4556 stop:4990 length:435 start_codon:yes stop_codon:yes gene_type:complete
MEFNLNLPAPASLADDVKALVDVALRRGYPIGTIARELEIPASLIRELTLNDPETKHAYQLNRTIRRNQLADQAVDYSAQALQHLADIAGHGEKDADRVKAAQTLLQYSMPEEGKAQPQQHLHAHAALPESFSSRLLDVLGRKE